MNMSDMITVDPDILGGTPLFKGPRVPVKTLFEYLGDGLSLDYFVETFPSVTREQAGAVLKLGLQRIDDELHAHA
jgi:uncharacterized protein (DUF433 family)